MPSENNWIFSNIESRLSDHNSDFVVNINKQKYEKLSFDQAAADVCHKLVQIGKPIYVGLSGGIDSEYVFRKFHNLGYVVKPVIVCTSGNRYETPNAFELCRELNVDPIVIHKSEIEYLQIIYKYIIKKLNGYGVATPGPIIAGMYAQEHNGIFVKAEHLVDEKDGKMYVGANEWDFYNDALIDKSNTYYFFMYTPEIVYSMISKIVGYDVQKFKSKLYGLPFRKKIKFDGYSNTFEQALTVFRSNRIHRPKYNHNFGSKENFLKEYF